MADSCKECAHAEKHFFGFVVYNTSTKLCNTLCEKCYEKFSAERERREAE